MKKRTIHFLMIIAVLLMATTGVAASSEGHFEAHLTGDAEVAVVPVVTQATGQAIFQLVDDNTAIEYKLIVANIDNVTQAHIHLAAEGVNGSVVAFLYGFALIPGTTNGVLATGRITAANLVGPLAGHPLSDLIDAMVAGNTYVNVHTTQYPAGEIRGQVK